MGTSLGKFPGRGVDRDVRYQDTPLTSNNQAGGNVVTNVTCTNP